MDPEKRSPDHISGSDSFFSPASGYPPGAGNSADASAIYKKSFMDTLDNACCRLQEKQAEYSIRRLWQFDAILDGLEAELDAIIQKTVE